MQKNFEIGIMFKRENPPEALIPFVQRAEQIGFDEVWIVEDCFYAGGVSTVGVTLASTGHIRVGLGIMPGVARNAAFSAMEIATLERTFPGRFIAGLGHGVADWMKQIGAFPASQLAALGEITAAVRALLAGERVTFHGQHVQLDDVALEFPPQTPPSILLGVRGPKSLQLSGRVADGTLISEYTAPAYIQWAREQIEAGQREAGREHEPHQITLYIHCSVDEDRQKAIDAFRPMVADRLAGDRIGFHIEPMGITGQVEALLAEGGKAALLEKMPDEWVTALGVVGTPAECRDSLQALADAGANSIVLVPIEPGIAPLEHIASALLLNG